MPNRVFWSWQSDVSPRETRDVIRQALIEAITQVAAEFEEAERPEIDQDTRGVPGMPDIVATILEKIDNAAAFVGDVTPISVSENGKQVANPNVLIELGYAKKSLGPARIISVWNTAIHKSVPEDLPFDLRHRRGPIGFSLPAGAEKAELRQVREALARDLSEALKAILSSAVPALPSEAAWQPEEDGKTGVWVGNAGGLPVNHGGSDPGRITVEAASFAYARLLPSKWSVVPDAVRILEHAPQSPIPLGRFGNLNWGPTTGGFLAYRCNDSVEETGVTKTATRWYRSTGEMWGIDASFIRDEAEYPTYSEVYAAERWLAWLNHSLVLCRATGGDFPVSVRLGIEHLDGAHWAKSYHGFSTPQALEQNVAYEFELATAEDRIIREHVRTALNRVRDAFGLAHISQADFASLANRAF